MEKDLFFNSEIGAPVDRVDGRAKVTGAARYAAEYKAPGLTYGVLVTSTIARGRIRAIDSKAAERSPGVLLVLSHLNRPEVPGWTQPSAAQEGSRVEGREFHVFEDDRIYFNHQPIALVIADTLERASEAARLVRISYAQEAHNTDPAAALSKGIKPKREKDYGRGAPEAFNTAPVKLTAEYHTPIQVHNPMEMHAATVIWEGDDKITVYNKTQAVKLAQQDIVKAFKLKPENVVVHSPYVGGAFGSSSRVWPQEMAAILGAKKLGRPVTVMARRDQVFNMVGYRPESIQKLEIGALKDGTITGISHAAFGSTSTYEEFTERITDPTRVLYACPYIKTDYRLVQVDMSTPCWTRAPGEASGSFALESSIDELAYAVQLDPLALRLKNFAEKDLEKDLPWSSNYLKECYERGAARFGWAKRNPKPGSMQQDGWLLGMGMSSGVYKSERQGASASITLKGDGSLLLQSSVADVGPGSATIMTQIAAEAYGVEVSKVQFQWGNSGLPPAPGQFGSHTTTSVGSAVHEVAKALQQRLKELAVNTTASPFSGKKLDELQFKNGSLFSADGKTSQKATDLLGMHGMKELKVTRESKPGAEKEAFSGKSFCANFVEVLVHPRTGVVKLQRVVSAIDAGKIVNIKTATSQVYGSVIWGMGLALMEEGVRDHRYGRYVNNDLADYHLPVNADIPDIEVIFIDKPDPIIDPIGAKGLGEIGMVGFAAAVANAVYHATGKRIRSLPITPDKLFGK